MDAFLCLAKPISLVERCYCRATINTVPKPYIRELRFIQTPSCPFQVMWVLFFKCWLLVSDAHTNASNPNVLHPGPPKKLSHRFPLYWTFLTINLQEVTGRWKELCTHVYTHGPLSLAFTQMHREKVVFTTGWLTRPQEVLHLSMSKWEREEEIRCNPYFVYSKNCVVCCWVCFSFTCHAAFPFSYCVNHHKSWSWIHCYSLCGVTVEWKSIYLKNRKWSSLQPETYDIVLTSSLNNHRGMLDLENSL